MGADENIAGKKVGSTDAGAADVSRSFLLGCIKPSFPVSERSGRGISIHAAGSYA